MAKGTGGDSAVSTLDRLILPRHGGQKTETFHFLIASYARGLERMGLKRFHFAFGVSTSRRQRIARLTQCPWQPTLFMTVCREIAEPRRETGARSREDPMRTRAVR